MDCYGILTGENPGDVTQCLACKNQSEAEINTAWPKWHYKNFARHISFENFLRGYTHFCLSKWSGTLNLANPWLHIWPHIFIKESFCTLEMRIFEKRKSELNMSGFDRRGITSFIQKKSTFSETKSIFVAITLSSIFKICWYFPLYFGSWAPPPPQGLKPGSWTPGLKGLRFFLVHNWISFDWLYFPIIAFYSMILKWP